MQCMVWNYYNVLIINYVVRHLACWLLLTEINSHLSLINSHLSKYCLHVWLISILNPYTRLSGRMQCRFCAILTLRGQWGTYFWALIFVQARWLSDRYFDCIVLERESSQYHKEYRIINNRGLSLKFKTERAHPIF